MSIIQRNNLEIYDDVAADWWSDDIRWVRTLENLVPGRLGWFNRHIDWVGKTVLDRLRRWFHGRSTDKQWRKRHRN